MRNPYNVLNISENATDEEVKEAYRNLARKYQSDSYSSGPLAEIAVKKMRELDDAYDAIILSRRSLVPEILPVLEEFPEPTEQPDISNIIIRHLFQILELKLLLTV